MQSLNEIKSKGRENWNRLVEVGQNQPENVKLWGVTAAAAVAGGFGLTAIAKGVVTIISALAAPPVALTVGAVAGGAVGWTLMQKNASEPAATAEPAADSGTETPVAAAA